MTHIPNRTYSRATQAQSFEIGKLLHAVCKTEILHGQKAAIYEDGWDDQRVASTVGGTVNSDMVAYRRVALMGKLPMHIKDPAQQQAEPPPRNLSVANMTDVLMGLSRRVDAVHEVSTDLKHQGADQLDRIAGIEVRLQCIEGLLISLANAWGIVTPGGE